MKSAPAPRILIVDDVPDNLRLLAAMLKANGYQARPVTSGKLAIEAAFQSCIPSHHTRVSSGKAPLSKMWLRSSSLTGP